MGHLKTVLRRVREQKLSLQVPECDMVEQRVEYLGFLIEPQKVSADAKKVMTIQVWPEELGAAGGARIPRTRWILPKADPHLLQEGARACQLLKKNSGRMRRICHTRAVRDSEEVLITTSNPQTFGPDKPVLIKTDASEHVAGAASEQEGRPTACASGMTKKTGARAADASIRKRTACNGARAYQMATVH